MMLLLKETRKKTNYIGKPTQVEKFPEFCKEKKHRTPKLAWMEKSEN